MRMVCKGGAFAGAMARVAFGLRCLPAGPGDRALYKVYPINTAKRQRGSKVVEIARPAG